MKIKDAEVLIQKAFEQTGSPELWADLGCGSGTFTYALANCLKAGSTIYAVDKIIPQLVPLNNVNIRCIAADMESIDFRTGELNGIVMANALHYVKDKNNLVQRLRSFLKKDGKFLVIEYDTDKSNRWVPFPLSFHKLVSLFKNNGLNAVEKIGERNSIFGPQKMYACLIKL